MNNWKKDKILKFVEIENYLSNLAAANGNAGSWF